MSATTDRCGFTNDSGWGKYYTCWREPWRSYSRCFWHADVPGKPPGEIEDKLSELDALDLTDRSIERLDGAILRDITAHPTLSFDRCRLPAADFSGASPPWGEYPELERPWATRTDEEVLSSSFENADLKGANFDGGDLPCVNFNGADLDGASFSGTGLADGEFLEADLRGANFERAFLGGAELGHAKIPEADFTNARLLSTRLEGALAERAIFNQSDLSGAKLGGAAIYAAVLSNVRLSHTTQFGERCCYDPESDHPDPVIATDSSVRDFGLNDLGKAQWVYRRLETLHSENGMVDGAKRYHIMKEELIRKGYRTNWANFDEISSVEDVFRTWNLPKALVYELNRWTSRHGESPYIVIGISLFTILIGSILYPLAGIRYSSTSETVTWANALETSNVFPEAAIHVFQVWADSIYFSTATFTTLGYGDIQPLGWGKAIATVESFLGALLLALFVFVLGRISAR